MASAMRSILGIYCLILHTVAVFSAEISIKPIGEKQQKALGADHVLTCVISGDRALIANFIWLDPKGTVIDANYKAVNRRIYTNLGTSGTQLQLFVSKLSKEDAGSYNCTANYNGETLQSSVHIEPYQTITFINAPVEQLAQIGKSFKIKCQVEAMPPPTVEWTRNNAKLQNDRRYTIENDGLVINNVDESDDGEYQCEVMVVDTGELKSKNIRLEVLSPPKIVNTPDLQLVTEGEKAQLICQATGKPKPLITWMKKSTRQELSSGTDGILYIEKVIRDETTDYTCKASNKAGDVFFNIHLSIRSKPDVFDVKNGTATVGSFGQIQCYVYGNPKPSVLIRKQTLPTSTRNTTNDRTIVEIIDHPTKKHAVIATMNFSRVELHDDGLYECLAQNEVGRGVRHAHLTVEYAPVFDTAVNVNKTFSWDRRAVNLTCIAEAIPNATITWFYNNRAIERSDNIYTLYGKGSPSTLQVIPIDISLYGYYKCRADNKLGRNEYNIQLKEAYPPAPVDFVEVNSTTATSITFKIQDPVDTGGLPIKGYVIQYLLEPLHWNEAENQTWARGALYTLYNLKPSRKYVYRFAAVNDVGLSSWGKTESRQMPDQSPPGEPFITNVMEEGTKFVKLDTAKHFELKWKIPSNNGLDMDGYNLKYCLASEDIGNGNLYPMVNSCIEKNLPIGETLSSYEIKDLNPDSYYLVSLRAHNSMGNGPASERFFKTSNVDPIPSTTVSTEPIAAAGSGMSSAVLIYIVVAILIAILVIVDVFCFFFGKTGVLHLICGVCCGKKNKNSDDKLGSETKDLISNGHKKIDIEEQSPMITNDGSKKDTAVEYDPKKGTARTGFVGKDSAV